MGISVSYARTSSVSGCNERLMSSIIKSLKIVFRVGQTDAQKEMGGGKGNSLNRMCVAGRHSLHVLFRVE